MAQSPVLTDQFALLEERLRTINKVMTAKAPIAQTPKELVWTLNKAKLYRYHSRCPAGKAASGSVTAGFRTNEPALHSRSASWP